MPKLNFIPPTKLETVRVVAVVKLEKRLCTIELKEVDFTRSLNVYCKGQSLLLIHS